MIKYIGIALLVLPLMACNKQTEKPTDTQSTSEIENKEIILGDKILIANELNNKDLKLTANNTSLSKDNKYYFQVSIENFSPQIINIRAEQIIMVDSKGQEHKVGLIDRDLTSPIDSKQQVTGMIGFDNVKFGQPKFIKFKEL